MSKTFLDRFPEFAESLEKGDKEVISLTLKASETELDPKLWGNLYEEGVLYLTADKLFRSRLGEPLRGQETSPTSMYATEFGRLLRIVSMGARVL